MEVIDLIRKHEGERLTVYFDTRGIPTIGIGRNLIDQGISHEESMMLFQNDFTQALNEALKYPWFNALCPPRQAVIIDMIFNLGGARFSDFTRMHAAIEAGDFHRACAEMLNSAWAAQVGDRALEDSQIMDSGVWV